ncbi:Phospholipid phosphatase-related protein type 5 [Liparis tanakae]|uniref:Phospholipid phosphatase-related protein type 5 n=1 Tax=Liparis tanakae TaxID=230148 RepID=A0A4Z2E8Y3_9TELE|nr:Phospholipid phosphatase-related protein type 5 [Liparis tanakae]
MFYFQLVIMAGTVLLAYYFEYTDTFPVHVQGFFCYDKSFSKPYPGPDDTSKIPPVLIYSLVTAIPSLTVRSVHIYIYLYIFFKVSFRCVWENKARGQKDGARVRSCPS